MYSLCLMEMPHLRIDVSLYRLSRMLNRDKIMRAYC